MDKQDFKIWLTLEGSLSNSFVFGLSLEKLNWNWVLSISHFLTTLTNFVGLIGVLHYSGNLSFIFLRFFNSTDEMLDKLCIP